MRRGPLFASLSSFLSCFKTPQQRFVTSLRSGLRNIFILDPFFAVALQFWLFFVNRLDRRVYEIKFRTLVSFLFSIFCLSSHFNPYFDAQNILFVIVAMLSLCNSPNCRSISVEGELHAVSELPLLLFSRPGIVESLPCPLTDEEMLEFSK